MTVPSPVLHLLRKLYQSHFDDTGNSSGDLGRVVSQDLTTFVSVVGRAGLERAELRDVIIAQLDQAVLQTGYTRQLFWREMLKVKYL
jgi:hypothetical protein